MYGRITNMGAHLMRKVIKNTLKDSKHTHAQIIQAHDLTLHSVERAHMICSLFQYVSGVDSPVTWRAMSRCCTEFALFAHSDVKNTPGSSHSCGRAAVTQSRNLPQHEHT